MSGHPSTWHAQSLLLSVRLYLLRSHSLRYTAHDSNGLSLPLLRYFPRTLSFWVSIYHPESLASLSLCLSPSHFPLCYSLSGLIQTSISLLCPRTEQTPRNFVFCSACVCVFCVFTQKTMRCSESGCPLKSSVPSCFFFWLSRALSKVENWPFSEKHMRHQLLFLSAGQSRQKKKKKWQDGGWQLPLTTTKTERNFKAQAPVETLGAIWQIHVRISFLEISQNQVLIMLISRLLQMLIM